MSMFIIINIVISGWLLVPECINMSTVSAQAKLTLDGLSDHLRFFLGSYMSLAIEIVSVYWFFSGDIRV